MTGQPQTLDELFTATTTHGKRTADLVAHAWKIGVRDGLDSAASAIENTLRSGKLDGLSPETRQTLLTLHDSLRLNAHNVQLPDDLDRGADA